MSLEIKVFAILVFLCAIVICLAIRNASKRISEAVENISIYIEYEGEEDDQKQ